MQTDLGEAGDNLSSILSPDHEQIWVEAVQHTVQCSSFIKTDWAVSASSRNLRMARKISIAASLLFRRVRFLSPFRVQLDLKGQRAEESTVDALILQQVVGQHPAVGQELNPLQLVIELFDFILAAGLVVEAPDELCTG